MRIVLKAKRDPVWFITEQLGVTLFPAQEEILRKFYRSRYDSTLEQLKKLIVAAGMRSGKTALASMMGVYEFFDVITLTNPSQYYGLLTNQPIFLSCVATSSEQATDGVYANIINLVEGCDFLNTWFDLRTTNDLIECYQKHVIFRVLSSWATTAVGRSNRCVIFDELANFEDTAGKRGAWEIFTRLSKSTDTFGDDGHIIAISSLRHPNDIMMVLLKRAENEPKSLGILRPTWEMNPNFSETELREEYKYDMAAFYRDYACQPSVWSSVQFPEGVYLTSRPNVLKHIDSTRSEQIHVCAVDPSARNDAFGMAVGYRDAQGHIIIDGATRFERISGDAFIRPSEIREFLDKVIPRLNVNYVIHDTWMFTEMIEYIQNKYGVVCEKHIVNKEDYDRWRELQNDPAKLLEVVYDERLKLEAEQLVVTQATKPKTDHPFGGSKDIADCVANVIWKLTTTEMLELQVPDLIYVKVI